jgi:hypothetical protein
MINDALMMPQVPVFINASKKSNEAALVGEIVRLQEIVKNKKETSINIDNNGDIIKREVENGYARAIRKVRQRPMF